jgi:hypothetical protein
MIIKIASGCYQFVQHGVEWQIEKTNGEWHLFLACGLIWEGVEVFSRKKDAIEYVKQLPTVNGVYIYA